MLLLVLNDAIRSDAVLPRRLGQTRFSRLRVGAGRYHEQVLAGLPALANARVLLSDGPLETVRALHDFIRAQLGPLDDPHLNGTVIYYDLRYFPVQPELMDNVLAKARHAGVPVRLSQRGADGKERVLAIQVVPLPWLLREGTREAELAVVAEESITVALEGTVRDVDRPVEALEVLARNFQARYFNAIRADGPWFVKSSPNRAKMAAEQRFLAHVPDPVKPWFPHVGALEETPEGAAYPVEQVFVPDAGKLLINGVFRQPGVGGGLLQRLGAYLDRCPHQPVGREEYARTMTRLFVTKVEQRVAEIPAIPAFPHLEQVCAMHGFTGVAAFSEHLLTQVREAIAADRGETLAFSHGDLCLTNILYDADTGQLKLIDPRGWHERREEAFLPAWYDLAKLSHSFLGGYELLVHGLVDIRLEETLTLAVASRLPRDHTAPLAEAFRAFLRQRGRSERRVRLYEATLFLSMIPLHQDAPHRNVGQLLQAMAALRAARTAE